MPRDPAREDARRPGADGNEPPDVARERATDRLVQLAGRRAHLELDPMDPAHARYLEWLAAESRAALSREERLTIAAEGQAFAKRLFALADEEARRAQPEPLAEPPCAPGMPVERAAGAERGMAAVAAARTAGCAPRFALSVAAGAGRELEDERAASWIELPPHLPAGQHVALTVSGDSMEPLLHAGDTILVRLGRDALVGDVVVARLPEDGYVVKRVRSVNEDALVLSSLNAAYADVRPEPRALVGTVVMRWCPHG